MKEGGKKKIQRLEATVCLRAGELNVFFFETSPVDSVTGASSLEQLTETRGFFSHGSGPFQLLCSNVNKLHRCL